MKPKQSAKISVDAAMALGMQGLMVSGAILSGKVFMFFQIRGRMVFARRLHMAAALLMAAGISDRPSAQLRSWLPTV